MTGLNIANFAGGKRKNGHKQSCVCHICENMKNKARRGGYAEELEKQKEKMMGGPKKKNGHRRDCSCPICTNMKNSKKYAISRSSRKTKKMRGGERDGEILGDGEGDGEILGDGLPTPKMPVPGEEIEGEKLLEEGEIPRVGGKKKKANGHKMVCKCPICKNMSKKKGGQNTRPSDPNATPTDPNAMPSDPNAMQSDPVEEASNYEYDALDAAEKGQAGTNVVGGTRKRRNKRRSSFFAGKKWGGKTRKGRKNK